jgi:L-malate glycosyltransferase
MKKRRILIIENSVHVTGALKSITRTAYDLKDFYDFVFVIPTGSRGRFWIEAKGFTSIYELGMTEISRRVFSLMKYVPHLIYNTAKLKGLISKEEIDIIHVNDLYNLIPIALRAFGVKIPYVCHIRFLPDKFPPWLFNTWLRLHLRYAVKIVAVSQFLKDRLPTTNKIAVIHNELPIEEKHPFEMTKHVNPTMLYLSNVIPGKGHDYALETFKELHKDFPDWRLRFVGGDMGMKKNADYIVSLKERARTLGIADRTEWEPFAQDVEYEYKRAHIVLNFSESESFSITCLEALYYGCCLIATASGGPAEIIRHGETGILVGNGKVSEMVSALRGLIQNPVLRQKMATAGRDDVRNRFSIQNTSLKLRHVYDSITGAEHQ